jgi:hypothetical protein
MLNQLGSISEASSLSGSTVATSDAGSDIDAGRGERPLIVGLFNADVDIVCSLLSRSLIGAN